MLIHPTSHNLQEAAAAAAEAMAGKERAAAAEAAAMMPAKLMAHAMTSRGIKLTAPQVRHVQETAPQS